MEGQLQRVTCPFNPAHVIEPRRLQYHIMKCKKSLPPTHDFVQCRFWSMHYVKKNLLDEHHESCEYGLAKLAQKRALASEEHAETTKNPGTAAQEATVTSSGVEESWDDIPNSAHSVYSPEVLREQAPYMVIPTGLSRAKRKEFREKERRRLQQLEELQGNRQARPALPDIDTVEGSASRSGTNEPRRPTTTLQINRSSSNW